MRFEGNLILSLTPKLKLFPHVPAILRKYHITKLAFEGKLCGLTLLWHFNDPNQGLKRKMYVFHKSKRSFDKKLQKRTMKLVLRTPKLIGPTFSLQELGTKFRTKKRAMGHQVINSNGAFTVELD